MGNEGFSEDNWGRGGVTKGDVKEQKKIGCGNPIHPSCTFFLLRGRAPSFWLGATGGSSVTCNHCNFEAKDKSLLSSLLLLMRKPEF